MGCGPVVAPMPTQDQTTAHTAKVFAIACMDFRLVDDTMRYMNSLGLNNNYDQFVLAGSSLGFTQQKYPEWGKAFLDHLSIGLSLHHFREIIFIDHKDCGAYKKFYPHMTPENEEELHLKHMQIAHDRLAAIFPNFKFRGYLMDIKGEVTELIVDEKSRIGSCKNTEDKYIIQMRN